VISLAFQDSTTDFARPEALVKKSRLACLTRVTMGEKD
jgi:hypothetical protein